MAPRQNTVNKFDYSDETRDYFSSSLWTIRGLMTNQEWWTVAELTKELKDLGFRLEAMSVSAHIRTLRKPPPIGGQYPCTRRPRERATEDEPREYEYLLGEWGTGVLSDEDECPTCGHYEAENAKLRGYIARYQQLVDNLKADLGWK